MSSIYDQHMKHFRNHRKDRYFQQCSGYGGDHDEDVKPIQYKYDYAVKVKNDNDTVETYIVTATHHKEAAEYMRRNHDRPCYIIKVWNNETETEDDAMDMWIRIK